MQQGFNEMYFTKERSTYFWTNNTNEKSNACLYSYKFSCTISKYLSYTSVKCTAVNASGELIVNHDKQSGIIAIYPVIPGDIV